MATPTQIRPRVDESAIPRDLQAICQEKRIAYQEIAAPALPEALGNPTEARRDRHGVFLAEFGDELLTRWTLDSINRSTWAMRAVEGLDMVRERKLATPAQAWSWALDTEIPRFAQADAWAHQPAAVCLARDLAERDPTLGCSGCTLSHPVVTAMEARLWPWLESAELFNPAAPTREGEHPLIVWVLKSDREHGNLAERWVNAMAPEDVNPHWADLCALLAQRTTPQAQASRAVFCVAVERAVLAAAAEASAKEARQAAAKSGSRIAAAAPRRRI